jgi:hypothetical protein
MTRRERHRVQIAAAFVAVGAQGVRIVCVPPDEKGMAAVHTLDLVGSARDCTYRPERLAALRRWRGDEAAPAQALADLDP